MFRRARITRDIIIPMDRRSRRPRGFAFVSFETLQEAERTVELSEGRSWGGRKGEPSMV